MVLDIAGNLFLTPRIVPLSVAFLREDSHSSLPHNRQICSCSHETSFVQFKKLVRPSTVNSKIKSLGEFFKLKLWLHQIGSQQNSFDIIPPTIQKRNTRIEWDNSSCFLLFAVIKTDPFGDADAETIRLSAMCFRKSTVAITNFKSRTRLPPKISVLAVDTGLNNWNRWSFFITVVPI